MTASQCDEGHSSRGQFSKRATVEQAILNEFLDALSVSGCEIVKTESPDFGVTLSSGERIWVELVEWHQGGNSAQGVAGREFDEVWRAVTFAIKDQIEEDRFFERMQHVAVAFYVRDQKVPPIREVHRFANEMVGILRDNLDSIERTRDVDLEDFEDYPLASEYVRRLAMSSGVANGLHYWHCVDSYANAVGIQVDELSRVLEQKGKKMSLYRQRAGTEQIWLLMYGLDFSASTFAPHPEQIEEISKQSQRMLAGTGFNEVWFYCRSYRKVLRMFPYP